MSGNYLKQSTASQSRTIGPFLDDTDFKTAETGLTIANTDIKLLVNGGASANKNSGGGTHRVNGHYGITFDATDTATVGELEVSVVVAGALPVFKTFFVLEEAVYDALFGASALGYVANAPVNVAQFGGSNGTFSSGRPEVNTTHAAGTAWASGAIVAGALATGAITAAKFAAGAIDAAALAADAATEIRDKIVERTTLRGTVGAASSTTSVVTSAISPATSVADQVKGRIIIFDHDTTTAALRGQASDITASSASATPTLTVTALTTAPASGDTFTIV